MWLVEENIKLGITETSTSEVMVTWVAKVNGSKLVLGDEVLEEGGAVDIFRIAVSIASYVNGTGMTGRYILNERIQLRES